MNDFHDNVKELVKLIPEGRVCTYGAIACFLGASKSSRMVGWVLNKSLCHLEIPAHRVVNRFGYLTGKKHFKTLNHMQDMLANEGVLIKNDKVINFDKLFWNPSKELNW